MKQKEKGHPSWTDEELEAAVEVYLYLLRLEQSGTMLPTSQIEKIAGKGDLAKRNSSSIRYRLRNISYVLQERGLPILSAYSPAPAVGKNVRKRIEDILDRGNEFLILLLQPKIYSSVSQNSISELVDNLDQLKQNIQVFADQHLSVAQLGHNNPPDDMRLNDLDFRSVLGSISSIQKQVQQVDVDTKRLTSSLKVVAQFGLECLLWVRDRITDFSKAAAIAAGTAYGVSTVAQLPHDISRILEKIAGYFF